MTRITLAEGKVVLCAWPIIQLEIGNWKLSCFHSLNCYRHSYSIPIFRKNNCLLSQEFHVSRMFVCSFVSFNWGEKKKYERKVWNMSKYKLYDYESNFRYLISHRTIFCIHSNEMNKTSRNQSQTMFDNATFPQFPCVLYTYIKPNWILVASAFNCKREWKWISEGIFLWIYLFFHLGCTIHINNMCIHICVCVCTDTNKMHLSDHKPKAIFFLMFRV